MSKKNLMCVFGCTGKQGGAVTKALLAEGFSVRGVTRSASQQSAQNLKAKGVELVELDYTKCGIPELTQCMWNCHGAYLDTNYFDPDTMNKEEDIGIKLVEGAQKANVKHIMWSTLPNVKKYSSGKWNVPFMTDKAKVAEFIQSLQAAKTKAFQYTTFVSPAFYYQNFQNFGFVKQEGDYTVFTLPATRFLTMCDVDEIGTACAAAFKDPAKFDGKCIEFWGEHAHPQCYVDTFTRVTGKKAKLNLVRLEKFRDSGAPLAPELAQLFGWLDEYSFFGPEGAPYAKYSGQMNTKGGLSNFATFLQNSNNWKM